MEDYGGLGTEAAVGGNVEEGVGIVLLLRKNHI